ncbi:HIT family protein [Vallitalea pronyensis]|uniref:HIT family protein n=1 Tax=Vallitalea pronyensis TaxID=1348613 RepID=A0A8J8MGT2_9FIRM|nr:HIT family protein [Vallitalea pronyensis]QUI21276.1 HIT family protein [Vallitalea pronyensis]
MIKQNCLFCNVANGNMASSTIFENSEFRVVLDPFPASKGHTLIIPKEHIENIYELDTESASRLFALATHIAKVLKNIYQCDGLNIIQNNGEAAGQTVFHFHLHLVPRYKDDHVTIKWDTLKMDKTELDEMASQISINL